MNIFKKVAISILATAISLCPTMTTLGNAVSASAATEFISDTDNNGALNIDENKITITTSTYPAIGKQISSKISNVNTATGAEKIITSTKAETCRVFDRAKIRLKVSSNNTIQKRAVNSFKDMKLYVDYYIDGGHNSQTYEHPTVTKFSDTEYMLTFDVITRGESFTYQTSQIQYISTPSCTYASFTSYSSALGYKSVEAKLPNGENIFISIRNDNQVSSANLEAWAKRMCMLVNSLSDVTNVKLNTVYMLFDADRDGGGAISANWCIKEESPANGYVAFGEGLTNETLASIASGNNEVDWAVMHELAHSYAIYTTPSTFNDNYGFIDPVDGYFDEYLTNARALTAIQNCDNLRNMDIIINHNFKKYRGKYNTIFQNINPAVSETQFYFGKKLTDIAGKYGWDKLETYYAASVSYNHGEVTRAASIINQICGTSISTSSPNFKKFANTLRTLYKLCSNRSTFDNNSFKAFVESEFGLQCILNTLNHIVL